VWHKYDDQVCRGNITPNELWELYQKELGFKENLDFIDYWVSNFVKIKETHDLMSELVRMGIPIGLLTNIYLGVFDKALENGYIPRLSYSNVVQSCEVGAVKPERRIYEIAQNRLNIPPDNILFIDDKQKFLDPAKELGWNVLQFDENDVQNSISQIRAQMR
jgi:FMN phosphatase YigB (HAD superfamily)